jgi:hypothetical protein
MYRLISEELAPQSRSSWMPRVPSFKTYRCGHCGAWLILRDEKLPKECGKCHRP